MARKPATERRCAQGEQESQEVLFPDNKCESPVSDTFCTECPNPGAIPGGFREGRKVQNSVKQCKTVRKGSRKPLKPLLTQEAGNNPLRAGKAAQDLEALFLSKREKEEKP